GTYPTNREDKAAAAAAAADTTAAAAGKRKHRRKDRSPQQQQHQQHAKPRKHRLAAVLKYFILGLVCTTLKTHETSPQNNTTNGRPQQQTNETQQPIITPHTEEQTNEINNDATIEKDKIDTGQQKIELKLTRHIVTNPVPEDKVYNAFLQIFYTIPKTGI